MKVLSLYKVNLNPTSHILRVKGKRTKVDTKSEAHVVKAKKHKVAKSEATNYDSASAPAPKRKRVNEILQSPMRR